MEATSSDLFIAKQTIIFTKVHSDSIVPQTIHRLQSTINCHRHSPFQKSTYLQLPRQSSRPLHRHPGQMAMNTASGSSSLSR